MKQFKPLIFFMFFLSVIINSYGQSKISAMLITLKGTGFYSRQGKQETLKVTQSFQNGDLVKVTKGNGSLLLNDGTEIELTSQKDYSVSSNANVQNNQLSNFHSAVSSNAISEGTSLYTLRGNGKIFPETSFYSDSSEIVLILKGSITQYTQFELYDNTTDTLVYATDKFTSSIINLKSIDLTAKNNFYWIISTGIDTSNGKIEYLNINDTEKFLLNSKFDYITAFNFYVEKGLLFDANKTILDAIKKFPDTDVFNVLYQNITE